MNLNPVDHLPMAIQRAGADCTKLREKTPNRSLLDTYKNPLMFRTQERMSSVPGPCKLRYITHRTLRNIS